MKQTSLFYQEGGSDKEYHIQIAKQGNGYVVNFQYGRRGNALQSGTKTPSPVSIPEAEKIFDKLKREKMGKGYEESGGEAKGNTFSQNVPAQKNEFRKEVIFAPQLLNEVENEEQAKLFIEDDYYLMQEKEDGERRPVISTEKGITGTNKKGQAVPISDNVIDSISDVCTLDAEIVGETLVAFDITNLDGKDLKTLSCTKRIDILNSLKFGKSIRVSKTAYTRKEKQEMFDRIKKENGEGVVFKKKDSPYTPGRPNSGGNQLKFKFHKTATFIVSNITKGKRSVGLDLIDNDTNKSVFMGKVTIPANHDIPNVGDFVEVRYLYAYKGGGKSVV